VIAVLKIFDDVSQKIDEKQKIIFDNTVKYRRKF